MEMKTETTPSATSADLYARAVRVTPGGVHSPVRAFKSVGGAPVFFRSGAGARLVDVDGRSYIDFCLSFGPLILGHADPDVAAAVHEAVGRGWSFGACEPYSLELAEWIASRLPWVERIRFVSSGTEAVMSAIRVARAVTGRDLIVKFSGCYHGHADHLLVAAGSGLATLERPSSAGVPEAFVGATRVLPLDDEAAVSALFAREGGAVAAVIVEPVPANHGLLLQRQAFLERLRTETRRHGALLIFDEVISGFRIGRGGAAEALGITPDMATFGKVIGGGMPVGAFGASRAIMSRLAPEGDTYQAGTLSGNPVAMAAGLTTLEILERDAGWQRLEVLGARLEALLAPVLAAAPFPAHVVRLGSLVWLCLSEAPQPRTAVTLPREALARFARLFHAMLARGIYLPPSPYEVCFLSLAHREEHLVEFAQALAAALPQAA